MDGLLNLVADGIETAFSLASEIVVTGTYTKKTGSGDYDPVTDKRATTTQVFSNVRFIETGTSLQEREASPISITDAKFLVPAKDLPIEPAENDFFELSTGRKFNVLMSRPIPGQKLHVIFGRQA
jgi:hypothetical protein